MATLPTACGLTLTYVTSLLVFAAICFVPLALILRRSASRQYAEPGKERVTAAVSGPS